MARKNENMACYAYEQLAQLSRSEAFAGRELLLQPRLPFSNMVLFRLPNVDIMNRFTLCADDHDVDGKTLHLCHIVVLSHISQAAIDELILALLAPDAFIEDQT
jgi:histidine decarboxylase